MFINYIAFYYHLTFINIHISQKYNYSEEMLNCKPINDLKSRNPLSLLFQVTRIFESELFYFNILLITG